MPVRRRAVWLSHRAAPESRALREPGEEENLLPRRPLLPRHPSRSGTSGQLPQYTANDRWFARIPLDSTDHHCCEDKTCNSHRDRRAACRTGRARLNSPDFTVNTHAVSRYGIEILSERSKLHRMRSPRSVTVAFNTGTGANAIRRRAEAAPGSPPARP